MQMVIIGIDCATLPGKTGLALAEVGSTRPGILTAELGSATPSVAGRVADWICNAERALLALDAPLGWPTAMGNMLNRHAAGQVLPRMTDVGADRIARTARAALQLVEEIRCITRFPLPLAWSPELGEGTSVIEVYPAATLIAHGLSAQRYKKKEHTEGRQTILEGLGKDMDLPEDRGLLESNADVLDAVICVQAAWDFLQGRAVGPADHGQASKEGWIWTAGKDE